MLPEGLWRLVASFTAGIAPYDISQVCKSARAARRLRTARQFSLLGYSGLLTFGDVDRLQATCWSLFIDFGDDPDSDSDFDSESLLLDFGREESDSDDGP